MIEKILKEVASPQNLHDIKPSFDPDKKIEKNDANVVDAGDNYDPDKKVEKKFEDGNDEKGLTQEQKDKIKDEAECSDKVVDSIGSMKEPNSTYELNDHIYKTDDNGNIYNVDGKNLPNCKYELNGYEYETDEKGRIIRAEGDLELPPYQPRPSKLPDIEDRRTEEDERGRDDKGHLIAHEFGGADTEGNLVPMNSEVNEYGDFRKLERELKNAKEEGHDVHVTVEPQYDGDSKRPSSFTVTYTIDNETYEKVIVNEAKSGEN